MKSLTSRVPSIWVWSGICPPRTLSEELYSNWTRSPVSHGPTCERRGSSSQAQAAGTLLVDSREAPCYRGKWSHDQKQALSL